MYEHVADLSTEDDGVSVLASSAEPGTPQSQGRWPPVHTGQHWQICEVCRISDTKRKRGVRNSSLAERGSHAFGVSRCCLAALQGTPLCCGRRISRLTSRPPSKSSSASWVWMTSSLSRCAAHVRVRNPNTTVCCTACLRIADFADSGRSEQSDALFCGPVNAQASGANGAAIFGGDGAPLSRSDPRVRRIPFPTRSAATTPCASSIPWHDGRGIRLSLSWSAFRCCSPDPLQSPGIHCLQAAHLC